MKVTDETVPVIQNMFEAFVIAGTCYNDEAKRLLEQMQCASDIGVKERLLDTSSVMASMARVQFAIAANLFKAMQDFAGGGLCHKQPS